MHQGQPSLQFARCARRDLRQRAPGLYRPCAHPGQGLLRSLARRRGGLRMAELLLELLSEEIPARMQARAAEDLAKMVGEGLAKQGLTFKTPITYVTPRRLALVIQDLPEA